MYDDDVYESSFRPDSSYQYNEGVNESPSFKSGQFSGEPKRKESVSKLRFNTKFHIFKLLIGFR